MYIKKLGLLLPLALSVVSQYAFSQTFNKDASQFCPSKLSAQEQGELFSRIVNIGASYSHGCVVCDVNKTFSQYLEEPNDKFWIRRNYLAQLFAFSPWKDKNEFSFEFMAVLENDNKHNASLLVPEVHMKSKGYDGQWTFDPRTDRVKLMDESDRQAIKQDPTFNDESVLVGGPMLRFDYEHRTRERAGHVYQTVPGKFAAQGAKQKTIFDLATDSARTFDLMRYYGDRQLFQDLAQSGWKDAEKRERLISKTVAHLQSMKPSMIMAVDALFWDTVPHLFALANQENPKSLVARFVTSKFFRKAMGFDMANEEQRRNMLEDFFEVLRRVSVNNGNNAATPILMARLIDNPGKFIRENKKEQEFGELIGTFIEIFAGTNFSEEFIHWLRQISFNEERVNPLAPLNTGLAAFGVTNLTPQGSHISLPRYGTYREGNDFELSADEVADVRAQYHKLTAIQQTADAQEALASNKDHKYGVPKFVRPALNKIILSSLGDIPLLIRAADKAFASQNEAARKFTARADNNVHLLNVDPFFKGLTYMVNPRTMHPSVEGAKWMATALDWTLCNSTSDELIEPAL